ncbi:PPE domain-containing protein [Saccharothrix coeruleofusca]|uniref:PPE domain-containing protein n=1 Tax=Saccharothrix coeruleofusca TaxID=33919 RepID=A0A918ATN6_9PSEU|nr:PPE domain-containing protein [Saccharothrix coeruleofusca]GGP70395.1 hypothetical protein GCM10010185_49320 [Saccharothrix coeruleofusca]
MPDGHRWSGYSHEELYQKINSGPGPQASHASVERWEGIAAALTEINAELHAGVARSGAHWEGSAADQARAGISPLAAWADDARAGADVMRVSAELQADFIAKARADMPPPVKVTAEDPGTFISALTHLVGGQTDYELQEKAHNAAEQRAREVMATYASSTTTNTSTLGQFHQPPQLVVNATEVVRNEAPGAGGAPGFGFYGGPRGGHGGRWGRGGGRGGRGRGVVPAPRPPAGGSVVGRPSSGGPSTGTSAAGPAQGGATTRTANGAPTPSGGGGSGGSTFAPGVIGGRGAQDRRRAESESERAAASEHTAASAQNGQSAAAAGHSSGTTSISSAEFGAIATSANAQHTAAVAPGGASGALPGAAQSGGDTVHKRTVQAAPQQPAFDPFGGMGARSAEEEEDTFHDAADYLRETDDIYGIGGMISPPVIGESRPF